MSLGQSPIERALASDDAEERRQATAGLTRMPLDEALPLLLRSLGDEDWRVRKEATVAARSFAGARPLVRALLDVFAGGDNVGLRNAAVDVLAAAGPTATAAIAEAVPRLDADGRKLAVETLGRGRDPAGLDALEASLADPDVNVRQASIEAIAAIGPLARERVQEILLARLDDRDRLVRLTALEGLTALEVPIPWERLAPLLDDPTLRAAALAAAALDPSPAAARALVRALAGARGSAFGQALRALGRVAEGPLASSVAEALREGEGELGRRLVAAARADGNDDAVHERAIALRLAAMAGAPGVVDAAVAALAEEALAEHAQRALTAVGAAALDAMVARLGDPATSPEARAALVDVVADVVAEGEPTQAPDAVLGAMRSAALDADRHVAVRALRALSRLGGAAELALAAEQTLRGDRSVTAAAEGALAALASRVPDAARALAAARAHDETYLLPVSIVLGAVHLGAASGPEPRAGEAGALSAGSGFAERDATFLAHAATAGDTRARRAAVEAVSVLRAAFGAAFPGAIEILSFALTDEEHEVQLAAARALGRLCSAPEALATMGPRAAPNPTPSSTALRPSEILELVDRSGADDLVAAAVRAIGEGMSAAYHERLSLPPVPPSEDLVSALALFARSAPSPVAIAAVDSLWQAHRAGAISAGRALSISLDHPDEDVVKAALLRLADLMVSAAAMAKGLAHPSPAVRMLAAEILGDLDTDEARALLAERLREEPDRRVQEAIQRALALGPLGPDGGASGPKPQGPTSFISSRRPGGEGGG